MVPCHEGIRGNNQLADDGSEPAPAPLKLALQRVLLQAQVPPLPPIIGKVVFTPASLQGQYNVSCPIALQIHESALRLHAGSIPCVDSVGVQVHMGEGVQGCDAQR